MSQSFDSFGMPELPYIILTNPNKEELYSLGLAYNTKITKRFNAMSEFEFVFPKSIDGGQSFIEAYDYLANKRLVLVEGHGYFQIIDVVEENDGSIPFKKVLCFSLENELVSKRVVGYGGTIKLYDSVTPSGTVLYDILQLAPTWSAGTIDVELQTLYRTFSVSDSNIYDFLMNDVSKAFECVFVFDTISKTISARKIENATISTDIFISFDNLIMGSAFSEKSDEITTVLSVSGGGNLTVAGVNPFGLKIYNFSYYKNTNWMSSGLVSAITAWETLVSLRQPNYSAFLLTLKGYNAELISLEGTLTTLNSEFKSLETVQKVRIEGGQSYSDILVLMAAKQAQIDSQEILISNKQLQINSVTASIQAIVTEVSFASNFTPSQLLELNTFMYENSYNNKNIIVTDSMTDVQIQDQQQALYNQATNVLGRVSQPRYELNIDSVNYIFLEDFSIFTNQTQMGIIVTCELKDGTYAELVLLELSYSFDNPIDFASRFSNRLRLDDGGFTYSDLMGEVVKIGSQVSFNDSQWSNWSENYKDDVTTFINSALDATVNNLINNSNQEILIDQNGLRGRTYNPSTQTYKDNQVWLTSSILAFTDNAWNTAKLALGQVSLPGGGTAYGLVADVIVGRLIAGNSLTIRNEANSFILDAIGATLTNATLSITNTNSRIFLDPANGLKIQQNVGGTWTNRFSVDSAGNVIFSGNLSGASGTFSGSITATSGFIGALTINSLGLQNASGSNYLRGNDLKWGALSITGSTATFSGTIFADKISGQVLDPQIAYGLNASKVTFGEMSADRIFGGTISWAGVTMGTGGYGWSQIQGNKLSLYGNDAYLEMDTSFIQLYAGGALMLSANSIELEGRLYSNTTLVGGYGLNDTFYIQTSVGYRYFTYDNGILVRYASTPP